MTVDHIVFDHVFTGSLCFLLVNPDGLVPMIARDKTILGLGCGYLGCPPLEFIRKRLFIEEDIRIIELLIKSVLELLDALDDTRKVAVACENNYGGVGFPRVVAIIFWDRCFIRWLVFAREELRKRCFAGVFVV